MFKKRYTILLGLTNKDDETKQINCEQAISLVGKVCRNYNSPFSVTIQKGGYCYLDGQYVLEDSLAISIIGLPRKQLNEIAKDLCCFFNQECVMIVCDKISTYYISENIAFPTDSD